MSDEKKNENEVTPEGAVEIQEEDLDQASGGAGYLKMPIEQLKHSPGDPSLKHSPAFKAPPQTLDLKKI